MLCLTVVLLNINLDFSTCHLLWQASQYIEQHCCISSLRHFLSNPLVAQSQVAGAIRTNQTDCFWRCFIASASTQRWDIHFNKSCVAVLYSTFIKMHVQLWRSLFCPCNRPLIIIVRQCEQPPVKVNPVVIVTLQSVSQVPGHHVDSWTMPRIIFLIYIYI